MIAITWHFRWYYHRSTLPELPAQDERTRSPFNARRTAENRCCEQISRGQVCACLEVGTPSFTPVSQQTPNTPSFTPVSQQTLNTPSLSALSPNHGHPKSEHCLFVSKYEITTRHRIESICYLCSPTSSLYRPSSAPASTQQPNRQTKK